jgi:hypothetical protein
MKLIFLVGISLAITALFTNFTIKSNSVYNFQSHPKDHSAKMMKAEKNDFNAKLSGKEVVPPVKTKAYGSATFKFSKDGKSMQYKLIVHNIDKVIMAHIHHAPAGKDGPIAVWLYKGKVTGKVNGVLSKGTITNKDVNLANLKKWIESGDAYVLVHTKAYPNGEIRGIIK